MKFNFLIVVSLISFGCFSQGDSNHSDSARLNTAESAGYLSRLEREVVLELNKARTNPKEYARLYIEPMLGDFKGNLDTRRRIQTNEGVSAVRDCIAGMTAPQHPGLLLPDKDLSRTALRHTSLQSKTRETGHTSPNGETFEYRLRKIRFSSTAECISYGENTARGIVVALLVDDGVSDRGHRKTILNPRYSVVGISAGSHKQYSSMCTLDFGGGQVLKK